MTDGQPPGKNAGQEPGHDHKEQDQDNLAEDGGQGLGKADPENTGEVQSAIHAGGTRLLEDQQHQTDGNCQPKRSTEGPYPDGRGHVLPGDGGGKPVQGQHGDETGSQPANEATDEPADGEKDEGGTTRGLIFIEHGNQDE